MFLEEPLAWVTAASGVLLLLVVAGPGSKRPFSEMLLVWGMAVSLIGASMLRLASLYDPQNADYPTQVGYAVMFAGRFLVAGVALSMCWRWVWVHKPQGAQGAREAYENWFAGHRRG